jgi:hypothetical protein
MLFLNMLVSLNLQLFFWLLGNNDFLWSLLLGDLWFSLRLVVFFNFLNWFLLMFMMRFLLIVMGFHLVDLLAKSASFNLSRDLGSVRLTAGDL